MVCLDEFDVMFASDGTAGELYHLAADLVQVAAPHRDNLTDFGIGSVVCQDNIVVPNKLPVGSLNLLRGREDMDVLREGAEAEKAKDNQEV